MNFMISERTAHDAGERMRSPVSRSPVSRFPVSIETISYATSECVLGRVLAARSAEGVCAILIGGDRDELVADLASRFPQASLLANEATIREDLAGVIGFVEKPVEGLHLL